MSVEVIYKCRCMSAEATIQVRHREPGEEITDWMAEVQQEMGRDHSRRSPLCIATTVEYAKIPMPENVQFIGGKPELNS
jgi:hypothetical protein